MSLDVKLDWRLGVVQAFLLRRVRALVNRVNIRYP